MVLGLPWLGYLVMVLDCRRYLRSLRRALVLVAHSVQSMPYWALRERPGCLVALDLHLPCTEEDVMAAYRKRVKACHPDQFPDNFPRLQQKATEQLRDINFAFQKLEKIFAERVSSAPGENPAPTSPRRRRTDVNQKGNSAYEAARRKPSNRPRAAKKPIPSPAAETGAQAIPPPGATVSLSPEGETTISFANGDRYTGEVQANRPHGASRSPRLGAAVP